jgi:hypothetical protein
MSDEASETGESLRRAATERLREAVKVADHDPKVAKAAIAAASAVFFETLGEIARRFPRNAEER